MGTERNWDRAFVSDHKGGAATRDRAWGTWRALEKLATEKKWKLDPSNITPKQMRIYLAHRVTEISPRAVQLEASHLRRAIAGAGRELGDVRDPKNAWSSSRMGVPSGSRLGLKAAANPAKYESARERMPEDVKAASGLTDAIGLRRKEAIMAGPSLRGWARELAKPEAKERGTYLNVVDGSKGGRPRWTFIRPDRVQEVLKAVAVASKIFLATGKIIQSEDLKSAISRYSNCLYRLGLTGDDSGHGLRRQFAQMQYGYYRDTGLTESEALKRLSSDLGHGDGRGRWVWNNYLAGGAG